MTKTYCDICGVEIHEDCFKRCVQTITVKTGDLTEIILETCPRCAQKAIDQLKKAAKREVAGDGGQG